MTLLAGLVQLEALEMLNSTTEQQVRQLMEMLSRASAETLRSELMDVRQLFDDVQASTDDGQLIRQHAVCSRLEVKSKVSLYYSAL